MRKFMVDYRVWSDEKRTHEKRVRIVEAESRVEAKEEVADKIGWDVPTSVEPL